MFDRSIPGNSRPFARRRRSVGAVLATMLSLVVCACSSDGPRMSGFALGSTRIVSVGETIELHMPLDQQGQRQWRVSSYDSLFFEMVQSPRAMQNANGTWDFVVRVRAKTQGETVVEVREVVARGQTPRTKKFNVRIRK